MQLSPRASLLAPTRRPQSHPGCTRLSAPCVLASGRPSHPGNERHSVKASYESRSSSAKPRGGQSGSGASQRLVQWSEAMF